MLHMQAHLCTVCCCSIGVTRANPVHCLSFKLAPASGCCSARFCSARGVWSDLLGPLKAASVSCPCKAAQHTSLSNDIIVRMCCDLNNSIGELLMKEKICTVTLQREIEGGLSDF